MNNLGKFLIFIQIIISGAVLLMSFTFLLTMTSFTNVLINMGALTVINEFDNYIGQWFLLQLKTYQREHTDDKNFLVFDNIDQK